MSLIDPLRKKITKTFNSTNSHFLVGMSKRINQKLISSSLEEIKRPLNDLYWARRQIGNLKLRLRASGQDEPYKDNPAFAKHKDMAAAVAVPRSFCYALKSRNVVNLFEQFRWQEETLPHTGLITKGFLDLVWQVEDMYGNGAQSLAEGVLDSAVFYQVYEAGDEKAKGGVMWGMRRLVEMSQFPQTGRCPENFVYQLCNSMVVGAMLRDADPKSAARLLANMFHNYKPDEAVVRIKEAPIIGMLKPSRELVHSLEQRKMPYDFIKAVMEHAGRKIVESKTPQSEGFQREIE